MARLRARRCERKLNAERGSESFLALEADSASVLDHKRVHDAQPQPRALPRILGCKEWVKNFADHRLRDAGACIGNEDRQGLSLSGCGKRQTPASLHVLYCVADDIHKNLINLRTART